MLSGQDRRRRPHGLLRKVHLLPVMIRSLTPDLHVAAQGQLLCTALGLAPYGGRAECPSASASARGTLLLPLVSGRRSSFCPAHVAAGVRMLPNLRLRHAQLLHIDRVFTRSSYRLVDAGFACCICEGCVFSRIPEAISICSAVPGHRSCCTLRILHVCSHTTVKQARYGAYRHAQRHISLR